MAFIIETGAGVPNANAYCPTAFVTTYLTERSRETENLWSTQSGTVQQAHVIRGTAYLDQVYGHRVGGTRLNTAVAGRGADGTVTFSALPLNTETVTVGQKVYRFVNTLAQENDVLIGASLSESVANLLDAINATSLDETVHEDTQPNYEAFAQEVTGETAVLVTALNYGESGNSVVFSTTVTGATITGSGFLAGGLDQGVQRLAFPRFKLYGWDGKLVVGVPWKWKAATAEAAVRSLAGKLLPDPTVDASGVLVTATRKKVGPIEKEIQYGGGGVQTLRFREYPEIEKLVEEYLVPRGGVFRA